MDDIEQLRSRNKVPQKRLFDGQTTLIISWITVLAILLGFWQFYLANRKSETKELSPAILKETANRLRGVGATVPAAQLLGNYLLHEQLEDRQRAQLAYTAATLYLEDGNYEQALAFLYMADESNPPGSLKGDIAAKIVASLEGMKKLGAAKYALKTTSALDGEKQIRQGGKVFAKVGDTTITVSEIEQALADLPPQMAKQIGNDKEQKLAFGRAYVAEQLLARKAQRLQLDLEPAMRRQITLMTRQLMVQKLLQKELESRGQIEEDDIKNYYEANKSRFTGKDGQELSYEQAKQQAAQAYMGEKMQKVYAQLLEESLAVEEAKFFPENFGE